MKSKNLEILENIDKTMTKMFVNFQVKVLFTYSNKSAKSTL